MQFEKLLVPIDFSASSRMSLEYALAVARRFRAALTLLHVIKPSTVLTLTFPEEIMQVTKDEYDESQKRLSALLPADKGHLQIDTVVKSGDVEEQTLSTIDDDTYQPSCHGQ